MTIERVLVVEDDELGREFVTECFESLGLETLATGNGQEALRTLRTEPVDLVLSDLRMPSMDGMELLRWVKKHRPDLQVALMTAFGTTEVAVEALRSGAEDILLKPFGADQLTFLIERLNKKRLLLNENHYLRSEMELDASDIVGQSPAIRELLAAIRRVAPSKATVFIRGESGTGKELAARAIHRLSKRAQQPFIRVNCAALSETLLESELFGHEKGSFTGAFQRREGRFELAHRGTLLLDEVSEVSPRIQAKLLRVLEEEEFERVGGSRTLKVDVRIVATSNRDLEQAIAEGTFREDLFYRLHVVPLCLTPLRERRDDIPLLAETFLQRYCQQNGRTHCELTPAARARLMEYAWPGNVRELSNFIQRLVVLSSGDRLDADQISLPASRAPEAATVESLLGRTVAEVERDLILHTLRSNQGNRTRSAEILGLTPRTISNKIRLYRASGHAIPEPLRVPAGPPRRSSSRKEGAREPALEDICHE